MTNPVSGYAALLRPKGLTTRVKTDLDRWMKKEEVLALLAVARKGKEKWAADAYDAFVLMANLGLRVGEIPLLQLSNFDALLTHQAVNIASLKKASAKKISRSKLMTMTPDELQKAQQQMRTAAAQKKIPVLKTIYIGAKEKLVIAAVIERRRRRAEAREGGLFYWGSRMLQYLFNYYRAAAKLRPALSCHALRRFVATHISESVAQVKNVHAQEPDRMASKRLRHQEGLTKESYIQLSPERQIELLAKVEPLS